MEELMAFKNNFNDLPYISLC